MLIRFTAAICLASAKASLSRSSNPENPECHSAHGNESKDCSDPEEVPEKPGAGKVLLILNELTKVLLNEMVGEWASIERDMQTVVSVRLNE